MWIHRDFQYFPGYYMASANISGSMAVIFFPFKQQFFGKNKSLGV